jgi:excisionase family DNA binding protein
MSRVAWQTTTESGTIARPLAVRVKEACRLTGIGRSKLYLLMKEGKIATIKVGSMTLIPMRSLELFLQVGRPERARVGDEIKRYEFRQAGAPSSIVHGGQLCCTTIALVSPAR